MTKLSALAKALRERESARLGLSGAAKRFAKAQKEVVRRELLLMNEEVP